MRQITIAGGGLAGLALGISLRQAEVPVVIYEAGSYPRHRVCGEFISGKGAAIVESLVSSSHRLATCKGASVQFFCGTRRSRVFHLPTPALCVSRYELDHALATRFRQLGGILRERTRWNPEEHGSEGVVRATGRRLRSNRRKACWGFKFHAQKVPLTADLEMYFSQQGYVGISKLPSGEVNICGLFHPGGTTHDVKNQFLEFINFMTRPGGKEIIGEQIVPGTFCSVAGIELGHAATGGEFSIGDSLGMIPPLTGNGMSIAFESSEQAFSPLIKYATRQSHWKQATSEFSQKCEREFRRRFQISSILQKILLHRAGQLALLGSVQALPWLFPALFRCTGGRGRD